MKYTCTVRNKGCLSIIIYLTVLNKTRARILGEINLKLQLLRYERFLDLASQSSTKFIKLNLKLYIHKRPVYGLSRM